MELIALYWWVWGIGCAVTIVLFYRYGLSLVDAHAEPTMHVGKICLVALLYPLTWVFSMLFASAALFHGYAYVTTLLT